MIYKTIRGTTIMDNKLATKLFQDVIDVLNDDGIVYWLEYGTLLGAIRDGDFTKTDIDIDIAINGEQERFAELLRRLTYEGLHFSHDHFKDKLRKANIIINQHPDKFAKLELVPFYFTGDDAWKLTEYKDGQIYGARMPKRFYDKLDTIYFKDRYCKIPNNVEEYLKLHYGDWQTPRNDISTTYKKPFEKVNL